jgi:hypothetical protein
MTTIWILLLATLGGPCQAAKPPGSRPSAVRPVERIRAAKPLVIAFAPNVTEEDVDRVTAKYVAFDDFGYYLADIKKWCAAAQITLRVVIGRQIQLTDGKGTPLPGPPPALEFGYILAGPDSDPRTLEGVHTDSGFVEAACNYFATVKRAAQACKAKKQDPPANTRMHPTAAVAWSGRG